jgi:uncharacterized protein (TIGR03083 family)
MDRAAAAADLWDRIIVLVDDLAETDWQQPTPCPGWTVHDLIGHLSGLQTGFDSGAHVPAPQGWEPDPTASPVDAWTGMGVAARRGWSGEQLRTELGQAREGHVARLSAVDDWSAEADGPIGRTSEDGLFQVRMMDVWVHLQDLRSALGLPLETDDTSDAAAAAHGYVVGLVPWLYVRKAGAQEHATMRLTVGAPVDLDTVLEVSMGRARHNPDADPGVCGVTASAAGLTLLAVGRFGASQLRALGQLDWSGPRGEEFVERARLF